MKEFGALFVSGYLVSLFFMLPLMGFYFVLGLKRGSFGAILQFHKTIVCLSLLLPLGLVMLSVTGGVKTKFSKPEETRQTQILDTSTVMESFDSEFGNSLVEDPIEGPWLYIKDVVFYIVNYIGLLSVLGLLVFILRYGIQAKRLDNIKQDASVSSITWNYLLIESGKIRCPFSVGYFRKSIFIPEDMAPSEKETVIQHELNHFRCRHHLWSLMEALLACVFWFNPFAHALKRRGAFLRELECDERTVQTIDRYEYSELLVKTAEAIAGGGTHNRFPLLTQTWVYKKELKMRIENLLQIGREKKDRSIGIMVYTTVFITVITTLIYGDLNDSTKYKILAEVNHEYSLRAPVATRVEIEKVPSHFINALMVHEDSEFYEHNGVRLISVLRAAGANTRSLFSGNGFYRYGGSTITQQLAKQFIDTPQRSLKRKFKELLIARVLERNFSKNDIMEMYLNMIYFGNSTYGLKAASEKYFGHEYEKLTLNESAMIVPFIDAPSLYNVLKDPTTAQKRQRLLLKEIASANG